MAYRILHCGKSIINYNLCIEHQVAGFTKRGKEIGDIVFFTVKVGKRSLCGMRAKLADTTDIKPWEDADNYVSCFDLDDVEYCKPFDIKVLATDGGKSWGLKYLQGSKAIVDKNAIMLLNKKCYENKTDKPRFFEPIEEVSPKPKPQIQPASTGIVEPIDISEPPEELISIMGTFQTIKFKNETDKAALIYFEQDDKEIWVPKSLIENEFVSNQEPQVLRIKKWILEKNGMVLT